MILFFIFNNIYFLSNLFLLYFIVNKKIIILIFFINYIFISNWGLGIGDWGLGIGDWGLGPIPNPQLIFLFL
jgi:hypothetical protein